MQNRRKHGLGARQNRHTQRQRLDIAVHQQRDQFGVGELARHQHFHLFTIDRNVGEQSTAVGEMTKFSQNLASLSTELTQVAGTLFDNR